MRYLKAWAGRNKVVTALVLLVFTGGVFYFLFGHRLVESMYKGELLYIFNDLFQGRENNSLDFYLIRADQFYLAGNILFACLVLGASFSLRLLRQPNKIVVCTRQEVYKLKLALLGNSKIICLSVSLLIVFYGLYITLGILLIPNHHQFDFFSADVREWASLDWSKHHKGSHPLILLFLAPFGFFKSFFPPLPKAVLAVLLNSFFGAFAVSLASLFFWILTKRYIDTLLLTSLFGLSMSQLAFSALPESYALASCSIITTYILFLVCLQSQRVYLGYWIFAGVFSFGVTITNFAQTLICFLATILVIKKNKRVVEILEYVGTVVSLSFLFSLLQHSIFPGSQYFFLPSMVNTELAYIKTSLFNQPLLVSNEIIKHFFLVNFVSASPFPEDINSYSKSIPLGFFGRDLNYSFMGLIGTIIWLIILISGAYNNIKSKNKIRLVFFFTIVAVILFNMSLHSVFGAEEMFLYTCNFTFPVLLLAVNKSLLKNRYLRTSLILLIVAMGVNNLMLISRIIKI